MFGYKKEQGHVADEITLLCDGHHKEKTNGLLPLSDVIKANASPKNISNGISTPYGLHFSGPSCEIRIAAGSFTGQRTKLVPLMLFNEEIVSVRFIDDEMYLSCQVRDRDDEIVLLISDNEMIYSTEPWDIQFTGRTLTIRSAKGIILFRIVFNPPSSINITHMSLTYGNATIRANSEELEIVGPDYSRKIGRFSASGFQYGIAFASTPRGGVGVAI